MLPREIVSGGQTGADQAGLDWAINRGLPHGGWCPAGRLAEDGTIPDRFRLKEVPSESYALRTEWNVRDSDATVIFSIGPELTGGSELTRQSTRQHGKPCLHLSRAKSGSTAAAGARLRDWVDANFIEVLNIAGPRASTEPGVDTFVRAVLDAAFPADA